MSFESRRQRIRNRAAAAELAQQSKRQQLELARTQALELYRQREQAFLSEIKQTQAYQELLTLLSRPELYEALHAIGTALSPKVERGIFKKEKVAQYILTSNEDIQTYGPNPHSTEKLPVRYNFHLSVLSVLSRETNSRKVHTLKTLQLAHFTFSILTNTEPVPYEFAEGMTWEDYLGKIIISSVNTDYDGYFGPLADEYMCGYAFSYFETLDQLLDYIAEQLEQKQNLIRYKRNVGDKVKPASVEVPANLQLHDLLAQNSL